MNLFRGDQHVESTQIGVAAISDVVRNLGDRRQNHISRPRGRRWCWSDGGRSTTSCAFIYLLLGALLILGIPSAPADAAAVPGERGGRGSSAEKVIIHEEMILLDRSPAPTMSVHVLDRRQDDSAEPSKSSSLRRSSFDSTATAADGSATTAPGIVSPSDDLPSSTVSSSNSESTLEPLPPIANTGLPKPFDGGLGTNYTQKSCPDFLRTILQNDTFTSCVPLSLLLQNSVSFFAASKSKEQVSRILDASCAVVLPACKSIMDSFAEDLRSSSNCGQDYRRQNPLVTQAYNGLVAYQPLHDAGCEKNDKGEYCFANAITNSGSPSDSYIYYLPLGMPLPSPSTPSCTDCLVHTMDIFQEAAANKSQPISPNYVTAAQMVDQNCGPTYANATLPISHDETSSASRSRSIMTSTVGTAIAIAIVLTSTLTQSMILS